MSLLVNWLESLHSELEVTERCSREFNHKSSCSICLENCMEKAILIKEDRIVVDHNHCKECGECVATCPLSAIDGTGPQRSFQDHALVYNEFYTPSIKELLIYKKKGIFAIIVPQNSLNDKWTMRLEETNMVLMKLDETPYAVIASHQVKNLSRRAFFSSMQEEGKHLLKSMTPAAWRKDSWNLCHYFPDHQFFSVQVNTEKCTLCGACRNLCTNQVFSFDGSAFRLQHQKCTGCTSCRDVCPEAAIKVVSNIQKAQITSHDMFEKECPGCKQRYLTFQKDLNQCKICDNRDTEWLSPYL